MPISITSRQLFSAKDLFIGINFPTNGAFRRLLYWLSFKVNVSFINLCRIAGLNDTIQATDRSNEKDADPCFLMEENTQEERAYLIVLLLVLGYDRKAIFDDYLVEDYWFRHKDYITAKNAEINKAQKLLKHNLLYGDLRIYVMEQKGKTLQQSIAEFKSTHPAIKTSVGRTCSALLRKYPSINPTLLRIRGQRFGLLMPQISTAHSNKHKCLMVDSKCLGCGSVRPYQASLLLRGVVRACPACKNKVRQRVGLVVNALTGKRYTTISKAHQGEGITSVALRSLEQRFKVNRAVRLDEGVLICLSATHLSRKDYQKYLPEAGLPADFVIPTDPDKQEKDKQRCLKALATKRRRAQSVRHQQIKAKRKRQKRAKATLATKTSGYWSLSNLAEYRVKRIDEGERIKQKVIEEDAFLSSTATDC